MNTNGADDNAPTFGQYCYDYADTRRSEVSSDYLALLGAYTFQGSLAAETAHFCGIFDGTNTVFPDVFSKLNVSATLGEIISNYLLNMKSLIIFIFC